MKTIDYIELLRIKRIAGNFKYKSWAFVIKNKGEFCTLQIEYPITPGAFTMGKKKSGIALSRTFYIAAGASEEEIMYTVIQAIEDTEKLLMMQELEYKGKSLADNFVSIASLRRFINKDDLPVNDGK